MLAVKLLVARNLNHQFGGKRVHHRNANTMQAARSRIGFVGKLTAGMERRHDDFKGTLFGVFGVRVDWNAAAIIGNADPIAGHEFDLDSVGMAGDRLIHGVIEQFGHQMVERTLIGAANIHAGPPADGFKALQNLNIVGCIALGGCTRRIELK